MSQQLQLYIFLKSTLGRKFLTLGTLSKAEKTIWKNKDGKRYGYQRKINLLQIW